MSDLLEDTFEGIGDFLFGDTDAANEANQARLEAALAGFDDVKLNELFGRGRAAVRAAAGQARTDIRSAYQSAMASVGGASIAARQAALRNQQGQLAQMRAGFATRGLGGSTAPMNAARAIRGDTNLQIGQIESGLAGLRSSLASAQGTGLASVAQRQGDLLASLLAQQAQGRLQLAGKKADILTGVTDVAAPGFLSALGGGEGIASIAKLFMGK